MSGRPKFSVFQPWVEPPPSKKTNGDRLRLLSLPDGDAGEERKANRKVAWFFATVAFLFVFADQLGRVRNVPDSNAGPTSAAPVSLSLQVEAGDRAGFSVRFRLSNRGNHPVFYPLRAGTNVPIGQIVGRTSPSSEWMNLSSTSQQQVPGVRELVDANLTWIEMPPGGWVDGKVHDTGEFPGDHAYAIYLKPTRDANVIRIVSKPYRPLGN
jgi:hypothetical protein